MEDTIFSKIIRREVPADIVYEDAETIAFLDIRPSAPGHTLVVPKNPSRNIFDMSEADARALARAVRTVAPAVRAAVGASGLTIMMNNEPSANQMVFHAHVHLIPRFEADELFPPPPHVSYASGEAERVAENIRRFQKENNAS